MKNGELLQVLLTFSDLNEIELPVKLTYGMSKNHKLLVDEYMVYEEQLDRLESKYKDRNSESDIEEKNREVMELLNIDIVLDGIYKVPESLFENGEFKITPKQLAILSFMIKQEE